MLTFALFAFSSVVLIQRAAAQDDIASLKWHLSAFQRLEKISTHPTSVEDMNRLRVPGSSGTSSSPSALSRTMTHPTITSPKSANGIVAITESISPLDECYPLHIASSKGHISCVRALLSAGSSVHLRDYTDHTPLYLAAKHGHLEVVKVLTEAGAHLADDETKLVRWGMTGDGIRGNGNGSESTAGDAQEKQKSIWKHAGVR